jgi:hypothetical protein
MTEHAEARRRRAVALRVATLGSVVREGAWRSAESSRRKSQEDVESSEQRLEQLVASRAVTAGAGKALDLDRWSWSLVAEEAVATTLAAQTEALRDAESIAEAARCDWVAANRRVEHAQARHGEAKRAEVHHVELARLDATLDVLAARVEP